MFMTVTGANRCRCSATAFRGLLNFVGQLPGAVTRATTAIKSFF